ncbi:cytochrome P450 [Mycobacterium sp. AZCC_0083]|uniref:cytochrome P450 n=1 Tax=Mycobacterium sp. AZCC_0083 TaxID=2735882 RepID=UPI00160BFEC9|nr:cytochrome P450 [Mycobacterium sp. AZCC_0083]MBB5164022.1 cytochrome P450 [Mycobacterium sp. AZCC_0083]
MTEIKATAPGSCPFDPYTAAVNHTTDEAYAHMRIQSPVHQLSGTNVFLITRYDDIVAAARDTETFSNEFVSPGIALGQGSSEISGELAAIRATGYPQVPTMLTRDDPAHSRFRRLTTRAFSARRIDSWTADIERICNGLIDGFIDAGEVEFVSAFAVPLPVRVIAFALGVPAEREQDFKAWTDHATAAIGADPGDDARLDAARGLVEFQRYFAAELEDRRAHPRDDFLTDLLNAEVADDDGLDDRRPLDETEMLSILHQLLVAGNETTTALLASAAIELSDKPELRNAIRNDRNALRAVVEELLRLSSPAQGMFRIVRRDVTVADKLIPEGATAILMYGSGNRDAERFECPDDFRVDRESKQHLAFGHGLHFCIGARLSRLESEIALRQLCQRMDEMWLTAAPTYKPSFVLSGPLTVPLAFKRAERSTTDCN